MSDFPKWLLALAALCALPVLLCPLYLFGGAAPFGTSGHAFVRFLLYLLTQLLWLVPAVCIFCGLDYWRRGYERVGTAIVAVGDVLTVVGFCLLCL